ncbi:MAG: helix-turn-helix transcriptional regulator [Bacillota bacterium]
MKAEEFANCEKGRVPLNVLLIISHPVENKEYDRLLHLFRDMEVIVEPNFNSVKTMIQNRDCQLIVFLSYSDKLPDSWKIEEFQLDKPIIILLRVNKVDLFLFYSYLKSIGLLTNSSIKNETEKEEPPIIPPLLHNSLVYIEENLNENDLSLEKVASSIFVSRCHYSRMFKEHFGTGFKEYIMSKRILRAKALFREGESVTNVCYAVGYGDLTHFGRVFKKLVGVTPSEYRRHFQNKTNSYQGGNFNDE